MLVIAHREPCRQVFQQVACVRLLISWTYCLGTSMTVGCYVSNAPQMSDALELSSWATCRLVAGQPSLLNTNYDTLRNRWEWLQVPPAQTS
jgi:hypothetical protein